MAPSEGDFIQDRPTPPPAGAASPRPEWLVGADEGLVAEPGGAPDPALERPRLRRLDEGPEGSSPPRAPGLVGNELSQQAPAPPAPSGARKIESRGAIDSEAPMTYGMADAFMNGSPAPGPRKRSSFAEPEVEDLPVVRKRPVRAMVRVESSRGEAKNPLLELLGDRRLHAILVIALGLWIAMGVRAEMAPGLELGKVRHHPEQYDGHEVVVRGIVGEVFPMGGSYAFSLISSHDTLTVFSRYRTPVEHQELTIKGSVSTGYLDGVPRAALYERK